MPSILTAFNASSSAKLHSEITSSFAPTLIVSSERHVAKAYEPISFKPFPIVTSTIFNEP